MAGNSILAMQNGSDDPSKAVSTGLLDVRRSLPHTRATDHVLFVVPSDDDLGPGILVMAEPETKEAVVESV